MKLGVTAVMLPELSFEEQIELCTELGVGYYQYRPRVIASTEISRPYSNWGNHKFDLTPDRLIAQGAQLTARLREAGLEPWGTVPTLSIDQADEQIEKHVEGAACAEAGRIRCQPPAYPDTVFDYADYLKRTVDRYEQVLEKHFRPRGLKAILETHAYSSVTSPALAWNVCRHFDPKDIGVIFDLPNFAREGQVQHHLAISVLKDYIDCLHVGGSRRIISDVDALGAKILSHQMCSMPESDLHLPTWLRTLEDAGIDVPAIIEDYTPHMTGEDRLRQSVRFLRRFERAQAREAKA